jgi:hypothetical protein
VQNIIDVYDPVLESVPSLPLEDLVLTAGSWLQLAELNPPSTQVGDLAARAYADCQSILNEYLRLRRKLGMSTEVRATDVRASAKGLRLVREEA